MNEIGLVLIITGVLCKVIYIIQKVRNGEYKPGKELYFLGFGLLLFFIGLSLKNGTQNMIDPFYLIGLGLTFKLIFIIKFIQLSRTANK